MKIQKSVRARLRDGLPGVGFNVTFAWDSDDPLAVRMAFPREAQNINWVFSRDMLHKGAFFSYSGDTHGDVAVWPTTDYVVVSLRPPEGKADVECRKDELQKFLNDTTSYTPLGKEGPRIEAALQSLIDDINKRGS